MKRYERKVTFLRPEYINSQAFIYINRTRNNTFATLTDHSGNIIYWVSAGSLGLTGPRRSTVYAGELTCMKLAKQTLQRGISKIIVRISGSGYGKSQCLKSLWKAGLKFKRIEAKVSRPHNGCRLKKQRRK